MTDNKTLMQQALDALERVDCVDGDCDILSLSLCEAVEESIAALRKAIAQPEQPAVATDAEVGLLVYRGNSVAYIYQKMQSYSNCLSDSWKAMTEIGKGSDGKTDLPSAIRKLQTQPVEPATDKLLQIIAATYQIAGACDAPFHILDVLANPEMATQEQIDAMLPFVPMQPVLPSCTWHELNDADRQKAFESLPDMLDGFLKTWGWLHFAKAIEAKCREKNIAQPAVKQNFCPRCGKRLGGIDDIHTCTPVVQS